LKQPLGENLTIARKRRRELLKSWAQRIKLIGHFYLRKDETVLALRVKLATPSLTGKKMFF
jgi:hypothetical protein